MPTTTAAAAPGAGERRPALLMFDAAGTRDRDDAFAVTRTRPGWHVEVHVANVADLVPLAGRADARAFSRRASRYRSAGTTPMLGPDVEAAATLAAGVDRRTVRFDIDLDDTAAVMAVSVSRSSTGNRAVALTYVSAAAALADPAATLHGGVAAAQQLAAVLLARRRDAGALAIYDLLHGVATTEEGTLIALDAAEPANTYMVVAEILILVNTVGAVWAAQRELPILYRNHRANPVGAAAGVLAGEILAALEDPARMAAVRTRMAVTIGRAQLRTGGPRPPRVAVAAVFPPDLTAAPVARSGVPTDHPRRPGCRTAGSTNSRVPLTSGRQAGGRVLECDGLAHAHPPDLLPSLTARP